jgi:AcrR family transcriptional regulator
MAAHEAPARTDAQRNRSALLDAAAVVLATTPQATLAEIATRAGLGRATLYRHFESREALREALRDEALARAELALGALDLDQCDTREAVRRAAGALVPLGMRFRILLIENSEVDADFLAARDAMLAPLRHVIARGVANGEIAPPSEPAWPNIVLAGLLMAAVRAAAAGSIDADVAGELVADTFLRGFGSR